MAKLVSMKISESERQEMTQPSSPEKYEGPKYPYGLCLHLDDNVMKKLAMKELPKVGKQVQIVAYADVTSVSERETLIGGNSQTVELQITDLAIDKPSKDAGDALYKE